jgi:hypothetical protein
MKRVWRPSSAFDFISADYSGVELVTLSQVCLWIVGYSRMAQIINETGDPGGLHAAFGAQLVGANVDEFKKRVKAGDKEAKDGRQASKAFNFGKPGGMGSAKLVLAKRKKNEGRTYSPSGPQVDAKGKRFYWGIRFCILTGGAQACGVEKVTEWNRRPCSPVCKACCVQADILGRKWLDTFPEMKEYFKYVETIEERGGEIKLWGLPYQPRDAWIPGSLRGGVGYTDGANGHFQGLAAILMKRALWYVARECYVDKTSPLYGTTRVPFVVHDEQFAETLSSVAHLTAPRIGLLMEKTGPEVCPNVKIVCEPALMGRWLKNAEAAFESDSLIRWERSAKGLEYLEEKGWA